MFLAVQFLTIFPIHLSGSVREEDIAGSMLYYPLVGALLGALSAAVFWIILHTISFPAAAVSAVIALVVFSGALHLDGLADMCDGFYGGKDPARILAIMKDSHCGAMAIVGVSCLLALKIALLISFDALKTPLVLIVAATLARWSMVYLCAASHYARAEGGKASSHIGHVKRSTFLLATLLAAIVAAATFQYRGVVVMAIVAFLVWVFRMVVERRIGGMTGDTLGACSEGVEVLTFFLLIAHWPVLPL